MSMWVTKLNFFANMSESKFDVTVILHKSLVLHVDACIRHLGKFVWQSGLPPPQSGWNRCSPLFQIARLQRGLLWWLSSLVFPRSMVTINRHRNFSSNIILWNIPTFSKMFELCTFYRHLYNGPVEASHPSFVCKATQYTKCYDVSLKTWVIWN